MNNNSEQSRLRARIKQLEKAIYIQVQQDDSVRVFGSNKAALEFFLKRYTEEHFPIGMFV